MRFLLGWSIKLGFLALVVLTMTGNLKLRLPETVLGYEVPAVARQWAERGTEIDGLAQQTHAALKKVAESLTK